VKPSALATLRALRQRGPAGLTSLEAIREVGTNRVSGRVLELRAAGFDVETHWETTPGGARIARYVLVERHPEPTRGEQQAMAL
jgi:hypothetical protein